MEEQVLRAVGYRRVSMREQLDGYSLDAQENNIRKLAQDRGWAFTHLYTDAAVSAKRNSHRPQLEKLMSDASAGQFDVVIVDKIDRFYRHLNGLLTALDQLKDNNVFLVSVQERLDFTTSWGKLTLTVLGMLAEIYIDNLRNETRKGKHQRARDGLWNGNIPYGYCRGTCSRCEDPNGKGYCPLYGQADKSDGKILIPHPVDSHAVKLSYKLYSTGEYSDLRLAEIVNSSALDLETGSVQYRQRGTLGRNLPGPLRKDFMRGLLNNIFYTGKIPYYGNTTPRQLQSVYPGKHPALVNEELFERVQDVRRINYSNSRLRKGKKVRLYPMTGIIRCAECGWSLRGVSTRGQRLYRDASRIERQGICDQRLVNADEIEEQLVQYLLERIKFWKQTAKTDLVTQHIEQTERHLEEASTLYLCGEISRDIYERIKNRMNEHLNNLRCIDSGAILAHTHKLQGKLESWSSILPAEQKRQLRFAVGTVWVRENAIVAVQPLSAFLPLMKSPHFRRSCKSGPDGI